MSALRRARARLRIGFRRRKQLRAAGLKTGRQTAAATLQRSRKLGKQVGKRAEQATPVLTAVASFPVAVAAALLSVIARVAAAVLGVLSRIANAIKPEWALGGVAAFCCAALIGSQFIDYSGVVVDASAYGGKLGTKVPAPIADPRQTGSAHAYLLIPIAGIGLILIALTLAGRWRLGRLVALCGLIAVAVSLIVDLPQALDTGRAGLSYTGTEAKLEGGFYAELASASMLLLSGALLSIMVHRTHPEKRRRRARRGHNEPNPVGI